MIRLSIIVPFYNVEKYIEQCIRSLYDQDIPQEEYEVICVDDCSPDGSRAIVERLQKEYPTLQLLCHTENKRQGGARNTGLKVAKGEYIWFVDSDDYVLPNVMGKLLMEAEKDKLDILVFYHAIESKVLSSLKSVPLCTGSGFVFDASIDIPIAGRCSAVWVNWFKRSLLLDNDIRFVEKRQYEDDDFTIRCFATAQRVRMIDKVAYNLRLSPDSTTRSKPTPRIVDDLMAQNRRLIQFLPNLEQLDGRWRPYIENTIKWTCREQVLRYLNDLSLKKQVQFYTLRIGYAHGLLDIVGSKTYLALNSFIYRRLFYR